MIDFTKEELIEILEYLGVSRDEGAQFKHWNSITSKINDELLDRYDYRIHLEINESNYNVFYQKYFGKSEEEVKEMEMREDAFSDMILRGQIPLPTILREVRDMVNVYLDYFKKMYYGCLESQVLSIDTVTNDIDSALEYFFTNEVPIQDIGIKISMKWYLDRGKMMADLDVHDMYKNKSIPMNAAELQWIGFPREVLDRFAINGITVKDVMCYGR